MKSISKFSLMLPMVLFIAASVADTHLYDEEAHRFALSYIRESFIFIALLMSLPLVYKQKWTSDRNVLRGLRSLFFLILFTYLLYLYSRNRLGEFIANIQKSEIVQQTANYIFILSWAFFASVYALIILGTLRNFIFIKRRKRTFSQFGWLMVLIILYAGLRATPINLSLQVEIPFISSVSGTTFQVLRFITINFMVINSFRVSWINFLNKKQKILCFWCGLLLLPLQYHFAFMFSRVNPVLPYSLVLGSFIELVVIFLTVYLSIAFLALLAHLPTARLYDRKMRQISSLHHLTREISGEFEMEKLVVTIVNLAAEVTEADFCWLELADSRDGSLELVSAKNLLKSERLSRLASFDESLSQWMIRQRTPYLDNQVTKTGPAKDLFLWKSDLFSLLAVPLLVSENVIGFLYAGRKEEFGFEQDDADMLQAFSQQAVIAVENTRLVKESLIKERLEQELKIAHEAQMKLLPKEMPKISDIELDAVCITANEVGGDYYDFFELAVDRLGIVIGDVSGKGPSAAFYMAEVKGVMEALAKEEHDPKKLLKSANLTLYQNLDRGTFVSLIYGVMDIKQQVFSFCRAGHCPILYCSTADANCQSLEPKGMGIGLDGGPAFDQLLEQTSVPIKKDCCLLLYTDGVIEARNRQFEEFGEQRLVKAFRKVKNLSAREIKKKLIYDIFTFIDGANATDDLTFIVIKGV
ncbi:SpoIIE family protein phosphatase [candidate division KSB1 bacterium]|nr:SpoIIE family protein phosphatase [candidate division KSB1 bacterium]